MTTAEAEQTELVPVTIEERIARQRRHLEQLAEKADERVDKAQAKAEAAWQLVADFDEDMEVIRGGSIG